MPNYKITVAYDGTSYSGWQMQQNTDTVQNRIKDSIQKILRHEITLTGAGRTDAGVHALGQIANFRTDQLLDAFRFLYSLNSMLPFDIAVRDLTEVPENFDARHSAVSRSYLYFISKKKDPFRYRYSHYLYKPPNAFSLNGYSETLLDTIDFASFSKNVTEQQHTLCNLYNVHWKEHKYFLIFQIEGNRFLHGMVRSLIGTLLSLAETEQDVNKLSSIIESKDRKQAGESVPARGLVLSKVKYEY